MDFWGYELRVRRDSKGLSLTDLGKLVRYNPSYLAKLERGERKPPREVAEALDHVLKASGALIRLWGAIGEPNGIRPSDHVANIGDHVANTRQVLAQMPDFPAESGEAGVTIPCRTHDGRIIFVTLPRRTFLGGIGLGAIAATAASPSAAAQSRTPASRFAAAPDLNPAEHFRQLRQVLIDNDNLLGPLRAIPTVESQIGALQQLRQVHQGSDARELLYIQTQYAEFCGWLYQDAGDFRSAQYWLDRSLEWSYATADRDITTYILARKSQLAGDMGDATTAIDLAAAASTQAHPDTRLGAIAATFGGYGHALAGDTAGSERELDRAHDILANLDPDPASTWGVWMDDAYVDVHQARGRYALGQHQQAAEDFRTAIAALPAGYHRDKGVYLARESLAHVGAREPEQAAQAGLQALQVAESTGSARIMTELARLDTQLERWPKIPAVSEFRQTFDVLMPRQA
ncbi:helix-turn-helix domain-containing protein [Nonomuraea lactucae]|uniref:helix-turn-helix domain-containing protein n=1 Tax=Nonomuraea lactucae TaxID=2249762 RepID=UPI001963FB29|nr:helix-turn-helix domain-containing protein [Nonomuraea lactucae]